MVLKDDVKRFFYAIHVIFAKKKIKIIKKKEKIKKKRKKEWSDIVICGQMRSNVVICGHKVDQF